MSFSQRQTITMSFLMKTLLNEIHDIIEQGDNGTPHDLIDVMFNLLDVNQLTQLEDIIVNQYGEN